MSSIVRLYNPINRLRGLHLQTPTLASMLVTVLGQWRWLVKHIEEEQILNGYTLK